MINSRSEVGIPEPIITLVFVFLDLQQEGEQFSRGERETRGCRRTSG